MSTLRWLLFGALLAALVAAGAARLATHDDASRLQADLAAAEAALRQEDSAHAVALARGVLEREPVNGHAFGVLARALADDGNDQADRLRFKAAARRAPRDPGVRAKLAAWALEAGDHATAVDHLDALLTGAPGQRQPMLQLIASMTPDRDFSAALAAHLIRYPQWRSAILHASVVHGSGEGADHVHGAMRAHGGLSAAETARWIDGMLRDGRWGSAYARWVSGLDDAPERLPVPWNGDFGREPSSSGFDWRVRRTPGVLFDRVALDGGGHAARLRFLGRPVARTGLEIPLLLAPGDHVLRLRARTDGLRSDQGLAWSLTCGDGRTRIAEGARLREAAIWTPLELAFTVPGGTDCEGQWLRLLNPAPRGVGQTLRGELQLTDVAIVPAAGRLGNL